MDEEIAITTMSSPSAQARATSTVLLMSKIGAMIGLGFGSLVLGMLPLIVGRYRIQRKKRCRGISSNCSSSTTTSASNASSASAGSTPKSNSQGLLTSLLLCFGGGVLLFTTFLHLAPEIRASVELHQSNGQLPTFGSLSLAELLFCGGFFLVYLVEEAVHAALTGRPDSSEALLYRTVSVRRCNNSQNGTASNITTSGSMTTVSTTTRSTWKVDLDSSQREDDLDSDDERLGRSKFHLDELRSKDDKVLPAIFVLSPSAVVASEESHRQDKNHLRVDPELAEYPKHHDHHHGPIMGKNASIQGLLTVLALSFHAIFEGLAVGLEPSIGSVVYLAAAIATHKLVISFCVGMELYVAGASTRTTLGYLTIFSMVTPIGIAVGLALGHFKNDSETLGPTPTILQGMAAGTLLYVVFFEVLARERANEKSGLLQLIAIFIGFMLMLGLQIATAHSHSHSHSHGGHGHSHGNDEDHDHSLEHGLHNDGDDNHDHNLPKLHRHMNAADGAESLLSDAIDRVTDSIAEAVSQALTSTTLSSNSAVPNESTTLRNRNT